MFRLRALRLSDYSKIPLLYNGMKKEIQAGYVAPYPPGILGSLCSSMTGSSTILEDLKTGEILGWYFSCRSSAREKTLFGSQIYFLPKARGNRLRSALECEALLRQKDVLYYEMLIAPDNRPSMESLTQTMFKPFGGTVKYHKKSPNFVLFRWGPIDRTKLQDHLNERNDLRIETEEIQEIGQTQLLFDSKDRTSELPCSPPKYRLRALRCSDIKKIGPLYNGLQDDAIQDGFDAPYPPGILGFLATSMNHSSTVVEDLMTGEIVGWYFSIRSSSREKTLFGAQVCLFPQIQGKGIFDALICDAILRQKDVLYYEGIISSQRGHSTLQNQFQTLFKFGGDVKLHETSDFTFFRWGPIDRQKLRKYLNERKDLSFETEEFEEEFLEWGYPFDPSKL